MSTTTWRRRSCRVSVDVDIDVDFLEPADLLQGLIRQGYLDDIEAQAILECGASREKRAQMTLNADLRADEIGIALHEIIAGRRDEALIHLERGLGRQWIGRLVQ